MNIYTDMLAAVALLIGSLLLACAMAKRFGENNEIRD